MSTEHFIRLSAVRSSTAAMLANFDAQQWSDADVAVPSLLPGWTRGHVLSHIARNADGTSLTLAGALRGEQLARYPDGRDGRNADIESGATRPAAAQLADVHESADRLDRLFGALADYDGWDLPAENGTAAHSFVTARWREVEIHRVDVDGDYTAAHWPTQFIDYLLPRLAAELGTRTTEPIRIEVEAEGSRTTALPGSTWTAGEGDPVRVAGPDWAVLAWLVGRPSSASGALSATPTLQAWS
ncbi:MAG: maleylpyruvate isomerase family mycothiol-dependent enzyme [Actinomycetota bacterium]